jgi:hypothetical protein
MSGRKSCSVLWCAWAADRCSAGPCTAQGHTESSGTRTHTAGAAHAAVGATAAQPSARPPSLAAAEPKGRRNGRDNGTGRNDKEGAVSRAACIAPPAPRVNAGPWATGTTAAARRGSIQATKQAAHLRHGAVGPGRPRSRARSVTATIPSVLAPGAAEPKGRRNGRNKLKETTRKVQLAGLHALRPQRPEQT